MNVKKQIGQTPHVSSRDPQFDFAAYWRSYEIRHGVKIRLMETSHLHGVWTETAEVVAMVPKK